MLPPSAKITTASAKNEKERKKGREKKSLFLLSANLPSSSKYQDKEKIFDRVLKVISSSQFL